MVAAAPTTEPRTAAEAAIIVESMGLQPLFILLGPPLCGGSEAARRRGGGMAHWCIRSTLTCLPGRPHFTIGAVVFKPEHSHVGRIAGENAKPLHCRPDRSAEAGQGHAEENRAEDDEGKKLRPDLGDKSRRTS